MPYRIASPPDPDPPDAEEAYVAVLRAQERRTKIGIGIGTIAFLALAALAVTRPPSRPEDPSVRIAASDRAWYDGRRLDARAAIATAQTRAADEQARFERGVRAAVGDGVEPRPELGACPVVLTQRSGSLHGRAFPLLVVDRVGIADALPSQAIAEMLADIRRAEAHIAAGRFDEASIYARALAAPDRLKSEVVVVTTKHVAPHVTGELRYEPGDLAGRAYLYHFASGAVERAADVEARSSETLTYSHPTAADVGESLGASLERDLDHRLESEIAASMKFRVR